ncbi:aminopeptidase P family protein [Thermosulfurimonas marina]|uniref:Aminopeptidase P family protein n=1 Tax=Thermosulfurimonas marina TaxID=2047767 RepID=A0A6H1WR39_9BACT|nr:Xaa-Pro peptidase family protein [Thermosulfurimonas marina]QJA05662.1 aminopeptidase P family protein [Thermosulfurimonas marina]
MPYAARLKKVQRWLRRRGGGALLVSSPENRRYLAGFSPEDVSLKESAGFLLITPQEAFLLTDPRYREEAAENPFFEPVIYHRGLAEALAPLIRKLGLRRLFYEEIYLSCARLKALRRKLPRVKMEGVSGVVERLRETKDPEEIRLLKEAEARAREILKILDQEIRPGRTEREMAWRILELSYRLGEGPSFPPIVASGPLAARPHAEPTERVLQEGEAVIVDLGVRYRGYCSDLTRTFFLGKVPERLREAFYLVKEAQRLARPLMQPGRKVAEADRAVRSLFRKHGVLQNYLHSLGHGLGLEVHETPPVSYRSRRRFRKGQVVTLEPGLYFPGLGGVREEEMVYLL